MRAPHVIEKETRKRSDSAQFLLTGRFGGSDRTLPPSIRSILERSNLSRIVTGHVRWSMTGRRQGPVSSSSSSSHDRTLNVFWPDAETQSPVTPSAAVHLLWTDRTLDDRVWCSVRSLFSSKSSMILHTACSQSSPNSNKMQINTNWDWCEWPLSNPQVFQNILP